jgi:hypothetical protein
MLYRVGRFLQLVGLVIAPAGLAGNAARPDLITVWGELAVLGFGILVFGLGWLIQRAAPPS